MVSCERLNISPSLMRYCLTSHTRTRPPVTDRLGHGFDGVVGHDRQQVGGHELHADRHLGFRVRVVDDAQVCSGFGKVGSDTAMQDAMRLQHDLAHLRAHDKFVLFVHHNLGAQLIDQHVRSFLHDRKVCADTCRKTNSPFGEDPARQSCLSQVAHRYRFTECKQQAKRRGCLLLHATYFIRFRMVVRKR